MDHQQHEAPPFFEKCSNGMTTPPTNGTSFGLERNLPSSSTDQHLHPHNPEPQRIQKCIRKRRTRHQRHRVRTSSCTAMILLYAATALLCTSLHSSLALETEGIYGPVFLCDGIPYVHSVVVEYDYRAKIAGGYEITSIVHALESAVLKKVESMLECRDAEGEVSTFLEVADVWSLGVVGMSAGPEDVIQSNTRCSATYCEVDVEGALTAYVSSEANPKMVSYALQHVIAQTMRDYSDTSFYNTVQGLRGLTYNGPPPADPREDDAGNRLGFANLPNDVKKDPNSGGGLTKMEVIILASIVSAVVGLIGTLILSKRLFTSKGDNCFAVCDGTGVDNEYTDDSGDKQLEDDGDDVKSVNIQWIVDMHGNNLSVIEEGTEVQSTISFQTGMTPSKALRTNDDQSIGSLSTVMASNKFLPYTV